MSNFTKGLVITKLSDVDIPASFYERLTTGSESLDVILGGDDLPGIMPGTSWLLTGKPGTGKSTFVMQIIEHIGKVLGKSCLLNTGEETVQRIAHRARRIGICLEAFTVSTFDNVDDLEKFVKEMAVEVLVVDSLQSLAAKDDALTVHGLVKRFVHLCNETGMTIIMIGHVTKSGAFAGKNSIEHDVDAHLKIEINKDTGNRAISLSKNRVGPAGVLYEFTMTGNGLDLRRVDTDDQKGGRRGVETAEFLSTVKKLLVNGEYLSGYSHDEHEELIKFNRSGGFMRAMLAKATAELKIEGFTVHEATINGRGHVYVDVNMNDA